jgi:hypothetical protein
MLVVSSQVIQEPMMFSTPEIYLQADLRYHRDQIRRAFRGTPVERQGTPVRAQPRGRLARHSTTTATASH